MAYVMYQDDFDPGMRYEGLARYAFNCERWGGPNNVAQQSVYNSLFIPEMNANGLIVLNQILEALIEKSNGNKRKEFIDLKNSLVANIKQKTAIELIDYIIKIINDK